jgi:hypothetical protein
MAGNPSGISPEKFAQQFPLVDIFNLYCGWDRILEDSVYLVGRLCDPFFSFTFAVRTKVG